MDWADVIKEWVSLGKTVPFLNGWSLARSTIGLGVVSDYEDTSQSEDVYLVHDGYEVAIAGLSERKTTPVRQEDDLLWVEDIEGETSHVHTEESVLNSDDLYVFYPSIVLHRVFKVPALCFRLEYADGTRCSRHQVSTLLETRAQTSTHTRALLSSLGSAVTEVEHPEKPGEMVFMVHPCDTDEFMGVFYPGDDKTKVDLMYLVKWWTVVSPAVYIDVPGDQMLDILHKSGPGNKKTKADPGNKKTKADPLN